MTQPIMYCPECHHDKNRLVRFAEHKTYNVLVRRRKCMECGHRWTTYELEAAHVALEKI